MRAHEVRLRAIRLVTLLVACLVATDGVPRSSSLGEITVVGPRVFSRERLVNDRARQDLWLQEKLEEASDVKFGFQGLSDFRRFSGLALGVGADAGTGAGTHYDTLVRRQIENERRAAELAQKQHELELLKLQSQIDDFRAGTGNVAENAPQTQGGATQTPQTFPATQPTLSTVTSALAALGDQSKSYLPDPSTVVPTRAEASPIDVFEDHLAHRERIRTEIGQNMLDDAHDVEGLTLYRMDFDVTVNRGRRTDDRAIVGVCIEHEPTETIRSAFKSWCAETEIDLNLLMSSWLEQLEHGVLTADRQGRFLTFAQRTIAEGLATLERTEYWIEQERTDVKAKVHIATELHDAIFADLLSSAGTLDGDQLDSLTHDDFDKLCKHRSITRDVLLAGFILEDVIRRSPEGRDSLDLGKGPVADQSSACSELATYRDFEKKQATRKPEAQSNRSAKKPARLIDTSRPGGAAIMVLLRALVCDESEVTEEGIALRGSAVSVELNCTLAEDPNCACDWRHGSSPESEEECKRECKRQGTKECQGEQQSEGECPQDCPEHCSCQSEQAELFRERWLDLSMGSVHAYGVTPRNQVERISDVAASRRAFQLLLSIRALIGSTGIQNASNYLNETQEILHSVRRQPLVVGFGRTRLETRRSSEHQDVHVGWILGPRFGIREAGLFGNKRKPDFRQQDDQHTVSALVHVPSWWTRAKITVRTYWQDESGRLIAAGEEPTEFVKRLPGTRAGLAQALWPETGRFASVQVAERHVKVGRPAQLLITGRNLWRSTTVTIGDLAASKAITVLPNMAGVIAHFDAIPEPAEGFMAGQPVVREVELWTSTDVVYCGLAKVHPSAQPAMLTVNPVGTRIIRNDVLELALENGRLPTSYHALDVRVRGITPGGSSPPTGWTQLPVHGPGVGGSTLERVLDEVPQGLESGMNLQVALHVQATPDDTTSRVHRAEKMLVFFPTVAASRCVVDGWPADNKLRANTKISVVLPKSFDRAHPGADPRTIGLTASVPNHSNLDILLSSTSWDPASRKITGVMRLADPSQSAALRRVLGSDGANVTLELTGVGRKGLVLQEASRTKKLVSLAP